jgi:DNA-binding PadR family transcriptional regulator
MAKDNPEAFSPDYIARANSSAPSLPPSGVPKFESLLILGLIEKYPPFGKTELANAVAQRMGDMTQERVMLKYIDFLVSLNYVSRQDFAYYITEQGKARIRELKEQMQMALNFVTMGIN